jgi:tetratricopeptide (TPR) repeat protein
MRWLALIFLSWALGAAMPAFADQNDPKLDGLFAELQDAQNENAARAVEQQIWRIWISHDDDAINALMRAGMIQMAQGDYSSALTTFEAMTDLAPDFAEGWNKRATVHWLMHNYQLSLADIDQTLALEPRHFGALSGRGLVYSALEQWDLALEAFESALAVYPQMMGPRHNADEIRLMLEGREI